MLRIKYKGRTSKFLYRRIKKSEVPELLRRHLALWATQRTDKDDASTTVPVDRADVTAEWQEGDGRWDDAAPTEQIPLPPEK